MTQPNPAFWDTVETIFAEALEQEGAARRAFVEARCAGNAELHAEVRSLLAAHDSSGQFLASADRALGGTAPAIGEHAVLGAFRLKDRIGDGGMGVVYRAERADGDFRHEAAVKILDGALRGDALRRFRAERQILATLHHPNIVTLLDGGVTGEGRGYLVMEYVDGVPISTYCAEHRLGLEDRLRLFRDVCLAVQHAHQHAVVHRDLKPANILVAGGVVKVLDFGVAKLLDSDEHATADTVRALTPNYASPEQLRGMPVTTASDIYALGVLLYELLGGLRPYETANEPLDRVLAIVTEEEPRRPSVAARESPLPYDPRRLRGDLDAIVLHAMNKDPERRYASARELSEDIDRFLRGEPVLAREPSIGYVAWRFARRHRAAVVAGAISMIALVAALAVSIAETRIARRERDRATARFNDTRQLAHALIFSIHDQVRPLAGSTPVRRAIVEEALKYLENLSRDPAVDDGLRLEMARGYHRIGDVQGKPSEPNLGDTRGALASLERGAGLLRPLVERQNAPADATIELASIDVSIAGIAAILNATERVRAAMTEATRHAETLVQRFPSDSAARDTLARVLFEDALRTRGTESLPAWRRAAVIYERILAEQPDNPERQRNLALVEKYMGFAYEVDERSADALPHYQRALGLDESRLRRFPTNRVVLMDVSIDLSTIAQSQWTMGHLADAAAGFERSLEIRTKLAESDPRDVRARRFQAFSHTRASGVYFDMHEYRKALEHATRAVQLSETLGTEEIYRVDLLEAVYQLAMAQANTGAAGAACQTFSRGQTLTAALTATAQKVSSQETHRVDSIAKSLAEQQATYCGARK